MKSESSVVLEHFEYTGFYAISRINKQDTGALSQVY